MKSILIMLNILLAGAVVIGGVRFIRNLANSPSKPAFTVKKRIPKNAKITSLVKRDVTAGKTDRGPSGEAMVKQIVETDIFNQDRCPNGGFWGGGNARVEMTLVGTFKIGKSQGAVILQKTQARNFPFMPFGGMMNPGGGGGGFPQRRMGIGRGGDGGNGGGGNGGMGMNRENSGDRGGRRGIGGGRFFQANRNAQGPVQPGQNNNNNNKPIVYKQYVRLGETMANGYTLAEIDRNRVVLTRGSDKLELELVDPSTNAKKPYRKPQAPNQTQVMQQMLQSMQNMQRAQMMQGFQMMRMNQQNMQNMQNQNQQGGRGGMMPRRR